MLVGRSVMRHDRTGTLSCAVFSGTTMPSHSEPSDPCSADAITTSMEPVEETELIKPTYTTQSALTKATRKRNNQISCPMENRFKSRAESQKGSQSGQQLGAQKMGIRPPRSEPQCMSTRGSIETWSRTCIWMLTSSRAGFFGYLRKSPTPDREASCQPSSRNPRASCGGFHASTCRRVSAKNSSEVSTLSDTGGALTDLAVFFGITRLAMVPRQQCMKKRNDSKNPPRRNVMDTEVQLHASNAKKAIVTRTRGVHPEAHVADAPHASSSGSRCVLRSSCRTCSFSEHALCRACLVSPSAAAANSTCCPSCWLLSSDRCAGRNRAGAIRSPRGGAHIRAATEARHVFMRRSRYEASGAR
mmetsp:Transcript_123119/g.347932  ORF Transcript_123119/g.347932 Transcript_123119/m.347932 type:complete len:359 (+) Transcript_123119:273-1349(+)